MYWDVKTVKPLPNFRIYVEIENGRKGIFDLTPYLDHGVFRELRDVHYFNQVGILLGAVTWPNEQDIAPETLLSEMFPVESTAPNPAVHTDAARPRGPRPSSGPASSGAEGYRGLTRVEASPVWRVRIVRHQHWIVMGST